MVHRQYSLAEVMELLLPPHNQYRVWVQKWAVVIVEEEEVAVAAAEAVSIDDNDKRSEKS